MNATIDASARKLFNRAELTKRLVAGSAATRPWSAASATPISICIAAGHRPQNFYMLGSMGLACPIALGVALAQPERGVIALEGDGSILMALGCLATIGTIEPRNLTIIIMDNGVYQITGKQPTATARNTDIVAIARGAGISESHWLRDDAHFDALIDAPLRAGRAGAAGRQDRRPAGRRPDRRAIPSLIRHRFMQGLGTGRRSPLDG